MEFNAKKNNGMEMRFINGKINHKEHITRLKENKKQYSRAPFSTRIRWMNAVAQIKFAPIEQSNQYEKNYLVQ